MRLLKEQDEIERLRLENLRNEVKAGFDQIEQGDYIEFASAEEAISHFHTKGREIVGLTA